MDLINKTNINNSKYTYQTNKNTYSRKNENFKS